MVFSIVVKTMQPQKLPGHALGDAGIAVIQQFLHACHAFQELKTQDCFSLAVGPIFQVLELEAR
ncbi:MAG: hypothetical protein A2W35_05675 [Chloroflexi bacterium RBG_16_57_11]|nr:MAG: hypothetical protein A2W35_05675 [Chloroflexi bacterium RBG_16_57_11]